MKSTPVQVDENLGSQALSLIDPTNAYYKESWLQELIRKFPRVLPTDEIEPIFSPLIPIGREVVSAAGSIDNLYISLQGYPVLVETKLWKNPDAKRDVLAQSIDYAAAITKWDFNNLDQKTRKYSSQYDSKSRGLLDWIEHFSHETLEEKSQLEETINNNLKFGRFLLLIVGDRIRSTVVDLLTHVNKYPHLAMNVALVELHCYRLVEDKEWPLIVVPSIVAKTKIIERSIVQVNVSVDGKSDVLVSQEQLADSGETTRSPLTEEKYWEKIKDKSPSSVQNARILFDYYRSKDRVYLVVRDLDCGEDDCSRK